MKEDELPSRTAEPNISSMVSTTDSEGPFGGGLFPDILKHEKSARLTTDTASNIRYTCKSKHW